MKNFSLLSIALIVAAACGSSVDSADDMAVVSINDELIQKLKEYDYFGEFAEGRIIVEKDGKYGFLSCNGKTVTPIVYSHAEHFKHGVALVYNDKGDGLISLAGEEIVPCGEYESLAEMGEVFYQAEAGGKVGILDRSGESVLSLEYDKIEEFDEDIYLVSKGSDNSGLVDKEWQVVIPLEYQQISKFGANHYLAKKELMSGLINKSGKVIVPFEFDEIKEFKNSKYLVKKDGRVGLLDSIGQSIITLKYDKIETSGDSYVVFEGAACGIVSKTGNEVLPCIYDKVSSCGENIYCAQKDGKWGFFSETGKLLTSFIYDVVPNDYDVGSPYRSYHYWYEFKDGLCVVRRNGEWGIIDKSGNEIIPCSYQLCHQMIEGKYASVKQGDKYGIIDNTGRMVVPCEYNFSMPMGDGLVMLSKNGRRALARIADGSMLTDFKYWSIDEFKSNGLARVIEEVYAAKGNRRMYGLLNKKGEEIVPCEFGSLAYTPDSSAVYGYNDKVKKQVVINLANNQQTTTEYDYIGTFEKDSLAEVRKDGMHGFVDKSLQEIVPCIYDEVNQYYEGVLGVKKGWQGRLS